MLQDISSAALLPEVAFFHQGPQPACHVTLPPCSMGDAVQYLTRQAWPERIHTTERNIWAYPCWWAYPQSACVQIIWHKVSLGSDTGWGPAFKIQYRSGLCSASLIWRFSHQGSHKVRWPHIQLFVFAMRQVPQFTSTWKIATHRNRLITWAPNLWKATWNHLKDKLF